eukprot:PhF_6_TR27844/c0_g2_i2/m.40644
MSGSTPCRYGTNCNNPRCPFKHPHEIPCRYADKCRDDDCPYLHPWDIECQYSGRCRQYGCPYRHPCRFRERCRDSRCRSLHPCDMECRSGQGCRRSGCPYKHPFPCRYGDRCRKSHCTYLHPPVGQPRSNDVPVPSRGITHKNQDPPKLWKHHLTDTSRKAFQILCYVLNVAAYGGDDKDDVAAPHFVMYDILEDIPEYLQTEHWSFKWARDYVEKGVTPNPEKYNEHILCTQPYVPRSKNKYVTDVSIQSMNVADQFCVVCLRLHGLKDDYIHDLG